MPEPQKYKLTAKQKRMLSDYHQRQHAAAQPVESSISAIDSVESLYKALNGRDEIKAKALLMLVLHSWLTEVSNFDPVSGHALHTGIIDFLDAVAKSMHDDFLQGETKDRIYRIVSHTKEAILAIMEYTRDKILREHAMLPIYAVREVDSTSVQWLSRQTGRTLREKLSGKPYIKAVRRRFSVDTAENRLLKAFLFRLQQILMERQNALSAVTEETCEELLVSLQRWLRSEDASEIGAWGNLPPNNTLLQDKRYRKVWDGWLWLQAIDEQITGDSKRVHRDILSVIYWNTLSLLNHSGRFRTIQQPIGLDYDNFSITPELPVQGYLFPAKDAKNKGTIKNVNYEKKFGPLTSENGTDLFFHKNNLSRKLDINSLSAGDEVSFVIGSNRQGECADDITLPAGIIPVDFNLTGDKWKIQVGGNKYLLQIVSGNLVIEQAQGAKKKLKIEPSALKEIPKTILSLVTDSRFEYSEPINNQYAPIRMDSSVVDLCAIRPMFTDKNGSEKYLPFRLLQQTWTLKDGTKQVINCGDTKAINLHSDIETISMRSLLSHSGALPDATKSSASMFFTKKLSDYIKADKLTYLVPDWGNDFDLEAIRKSVNFYFDKSTPLPKSIAAIFAWQSSMESQKIELNNDSEILVVDSFYGRFSVTPITVQFSKKLKDTLPPTKGITWERHPIFLIENKNILKEVVDKLHVAKCPFPEEVIQLFGLDGLFQEAGKLTLENDSVPFHIPGNIIDILRINQSLKSASSSTELKKYLEKKSQANIFVLPISQSIIIDPLLEGYKKLSVNGGISLTEGALFLEKWQKEIAELDVVLWRDHLPELSVRIVRDGHFENFYLVKDATVTPQRGRPANIPVKESFTLPAGQTHYSFPLQQGEGNKELQFVAYLKSPAFPLKEDTNCKLKMTYTYGADDPYELKFIPLDSAKAGFKSIRVEWRSASEGETADLENLPVPDFPARKSWSDFQNFEERNGDSLLDWVEKDIEKICDIVSFLAGEDSNRIYDDDIADRWNWKEDRYGKQFCYLKYDGIGDVFFHESNYDRFDPEAYEISFDLEKQRDRNGYKARNITLGKSVSKRTVEHFRKSLRFPALTIWNHGHSLSESDVPDHFRNSIFEGTQKILSIIESENMPDTLKEELFFFLCCLHKDAPEYVGKRLIEMSDDPDIFLKYNRNISFAIGNAGLPWQEKLLEKVLNSKRPIALEMIAIAIWRSEELIHKLSKIKLKSLSKILLNATLADLESISSEVQQDRVDRLVEKGLTEEDAVERERGYQASTLCKHLELLLALLRSRGIEDDGVKMIFAPDNDLTKKYVTLVDDVSRIVMEKDIKLKSRISLQIEKPEMFRNTPDLLYALRMYLTGDSGANTIVITGVSDED